MKSFMTVDDIKKIIAQGEGISIEFKRAKEKVPQSVYETVVSFANTRGGYILLGVDDDGTVLGIQPENKAKFIKDIATALNSKDNINPVMYLNPSSIEYEGKTVIVIQVPASSQVHYHAGRVYIREYETDLDVTSNQHTIRRLFLKKGNIYTEKHIFPGLKMSDLDESLFEKARNFIYSKQHDHPWLKVDNMQMLREAGLYWNDLENNREGFSLAAGLIFGKDLTIQYLLPAYKVDAMVRIKNKDRWDDRLILRTNLIDTYLKLKEFLYRHLPDKFYLEGDQRIDLRDRIFREVVGNILIHREYTDAIATELIIEEDVVHTLNPNNPYFHGIMDLNKFSPHPKNPNIRKFFMALGWADEAGSGIRNTQKYLPFYVEKAAPVFIDEQMFRIIIPLVRYSMADFGDKWFQWLELDEKWRSKLTESLKNIEIDGQLHKMEWEEQISFLSLSWIEKITKFVPSISKNRTKTLISKTAYNQEYKSNQISSSCEISTKLPLSPIEKVTKLPIKKLQYVIVILMLSGIPISLDELVELLSFRDKSFFNRNYIKSLETIGFIRKTNPEKPTASNQKYLITEHGKRFLSAIND